MATKLRKSKQILRVERLEKEREDVIESTTDAESLAYEASILRFADEARRAVASEDSSAAKIAALLLLVASNSNETKRLWQRRRTALLRVARASVAPISSTPVAVETLDVVLGELPNSTLPTGSGMAGEFASLRQYHQTEIVRPYRDAVLTNTELNAQTDAAVSTRAERAAKQARSFHTTSDRRLARLAANMAANRERFDLYQYVGPGPDPIIRAFCAPRLNRIYSLEQIENMENGQPGAGPVLIAGGGYNCRHHWRPVRERWFDRAEYARLRGDE